MHGVRKLPPGAIDEARKLSEKKKLDAYMGLVEKYAGTRRAMHASDDVSCVRGIRRVFFFFLFLSVMV
jgi:hypothetical protein